MAADVNSEEERGFLTGFPIWMVLVLAGVLIVALSICLVLVFSLGGGDEVDQEGMPTLMSTAGVPISGGSPGVPGPSETESIPGLAATYTPVSWPITPTATITGSESTATAAAQTATAIATLTPKPTATNTPTRLPIPTRTPYTPRPPATNTPRPPVILTSTPTPAGTGPWVGQYFANQTLSGSPTLGRNDDNILFNWGTGSPDPSIPVDHFSIRWDRTVSFAAGTYQFSVFSDDGVRVYVDGQLIINQWHNATNTVYAAERTLSTGNHNLRVEYYEDTGTAQIQFWWELGAGTSAGWRGEYFSNMTLSGSPTLTRNDPEIFFNWGAGRPASGLPTDHFSVRWTREAGFTAGNYRFTVQSDDGVRVWVDNQLIIDEWHDADGQIYRATRSLSSGVHNLRVEYYENLDQAKIQFYWELDGAYPNWRGAYFTNANLTGAPTVTRNDVSINFDWGDGSPASGIPADNFSVMWTRQQFFQEGSYIFHARVDDGVRIYVDGVRVVNSWQDGSLREVSGDVTLSAGDHLVRVDYYDRLHQAAIQVWWELAESPYPDWNGEYFNNPNLVDPPVFTRSDIAINFDWGNGSPGNGIPNDNFSVRWSRSFAYDPGIYRLSAQSDDGIRVYVNNVLVINEWHQSDGQTVYTVDRPFSGGTDTIRVEYYEGTGAALVHFWMQRIGDLP